MKVHLGYSDYMGYPREMEWTVLSICMYILYTTIVKNGGSP